MNVPNDLSQIAAIIKNDWKNIKPEAVSFLKAMHPLHSIYDKFGDKSGKAIIEGFLHHARYWKGDTATEVKRKLRELIK